MAEERNIKIDCPVCEEEVEISARDIRLAIQHKNKTGGKALVSCPECCRVLVLPEGVPESGDALEEWVTKEAENPEDCCGCVPVLDENVVKTPTGGYKDLNVWYYRPGGGGNALRKREYMLEYGINPECYMNKNPSMGGKPTKVGA